MEDYVEESVIRVYNFTTKESTESKGLEQIRKCFVELFASLTDLSGLEVPVIDVDEEGM